MIRVFFDESVSSAEVSPDGIFTLGGYLAHFEDWDRLERAWCGMLYGAGVKELHMADLENRVGEFKDWPDERRHPLLSQAYALIAESVPVGFWVGLDLAGVRALCNSGLPREAVIKRAYGLGVHHLTHRILQTAPAGQKPIVVMFDENRLCREDGFSAFYRVKDKWDPRGILDVPLWKPSAEFPGLQAADLIAYEVMKELFNGDDGLGRRRDDKHGKMVPPRYVLRSVASHDIMTRPLYYTGFYDPRGVRGLALEYERNEGRIIRDAFDPATLQ